MRRATGPPPADYFAAARPRAGEARLALGFGDLTLCLCGLERTLCERLRERYGRFVLEEASGGLQVQVGVDEREYYIEPPARAELNPVYLACDGQRVRFVGYRLAGWFDTVGDEAQMLIARGEYEPPERAVENFVRAAVAWRSAERGGALVHAASAILDGRGYLFYGESGAGKSTLAECNRRGQVLSDDLSLVLPAGDGSPQLVGSPFRGTYEGGEVVVGRFPLCAGFRIIQAERAAVRDAPRSRAMAELVGNLPFVAEAYGRRPDLLRRVERTFEGLPLAHLHFRKDDSYWDAIRASGL